MKKGEAIIQFTMNIKEEVMRTHYLSTHIANSVILIAVILGIVIPPSSSLATGQYKGFFIVDPDKKVFLKSYSDWADKWTKWAFQIPTATNPILDVTGEYCDQGQRGPVWFLAGAFLSDPPADPIVRECRIPAGKFVFLPIAQGLSFSPEFPSDDDVCFNSDLPEVEQVRCDVNDDIVKDIKGLELTIDGVRVNDPFAYRAQSPPGGFVLFVPKNTIITDFYGYVPGPRDPAVADGWWLMIYLKPGEHTINIVVQISENKGIAMDVTYNLIVDSWHH
jgi:hypothetical protein